MARVKHNFLFRFGDKFFLVLVALGIAFAFWRLSTATKISEGEDPVTRIRDAERRIEQLLKEPPPPIDLNQFDYMQRIMKRYGRIAAPPVLRRWILWKPRPKIYPTVYIGIDKRKYIDFEKPLDPGSVSSDKPFIVEAFHGPDNPWTRGRRWNVVMIRSHTQEGFARVRGFEGPRQHIVPVIVSRDVDRRVEPPQDLTAETSRSRVRLGWNNNKDNVRLQIQLIEYQVYRKRVADAIAPFELIARVNVGTPSATGPGIRPAEPMLPGEGTIRPEEPGRVRPGEKAPTRRDYWYEDKTVVPDERYQYKVRARALKSYPPESEFSEPLVVVTPPDVDFVFEGASADSVRIRVYKEVKGVIHEHQFSGVKRGEPIGKVVLLREQKEAVNFFTGCWVVDWHRRITGPRYNREGKSTGREGATDRLIFADKNGKGKMRWRNEVVTPELVNPPEPKTERRPEDVPPEELRPDIYR
jgi:hypothetical protein